MRVITGTARGVPLKAPKGMDTRPTMDQVKEGIFSAIQFEVEGRRALDLFAGTGAVSIELLSRGCESVTAVEKSNIQYNFIRKVAQELGEKNLTLIKGDVFKFVAACRTQFDFIFADPPYDLPRFGEIPGLVLNSGMLHPGSVFIIEHSRDYDFSSMPHFSSHRVYGSVNFSIFEIPEEE